MLLFWSINLCSICVPNEWGRYSSHLIRDAIEIATSIVDSDVMAIDPEKCRLAKNKCISIGRYKSSDPESVDLRARIPLKINDIVH
jgi:hypothetical protein